MITVLRVLWICLLSSPFVLSGALGKDDPESDRQECEEKLVPLLPMETQGFWSTLDAVEQRSAALTFQSFWVRSSVLRRSETEATASFIIVAERTLTGDLDKGQLKYAWAANFLDSLAQLPNTTPETKKILLGIVEILGS